MHLSGPVHHSEHSHSRRIPMDFVYIVTCPRMGWPWKNPNHPYTLGADKVQNPVEILRIAAGTGTTRMKRYRKSKSLELVVTTSTKGPRGP